MHHNIRFYNPHIEQNSLNLITLCSGYSTIDSFVWNFHETASYSRLFFIIDAEEAYIENEHGSYILRPGHMYLVPSYCNNHFVCTKFLDHYSIHFNVELFANLDILGSYFNTVQELPFSQELLDQFLAAEKSTTLANVIRLNSLLWQVIHEFISHYETDFNYEMLVEGFLRQRPVLQYLSTHLSASLRIQDIADSLNIPIRKLSRAFQQDIGFPLKTYMERMLIHKATCLLLQTPATIVQIADQLGFSDPFYFSRFFKKQLGIAPNKYRKQRF